jgi:hypothetical protein
MGTGPIVILIFATERISLDVRIEVVTIKCTTVAVSRELQLSKNKKGEWVMWCVEKEGHRRLIVGGQGKTRIWKRSAERPDHLALDAND